MPSNYYEVLQIEPDSSMEDIRSAFRRMVLQHHPDLNSNQVSASESTILLYEAYNTLSHAERRKAYDSSLKAASTTKRTAHPKTVRPPSPRLREPEPVTCIRCGHCDDTLRYSDFRMVYGQIWRTRKVAVQSGVYCSLCRFILGTKWLVLCSILGWWSIPGAFWTLTALPKNSVGGLGSWRVQQPVLLSLARRLMWIHQFGDAGRVLKQLQHSNPGNAEIAKMIAEVNRRAGEGLPRRSPSAIARRIPLPAVSLPATIVPVLLACQYANTALAQRAHSNPDDRRMPHTHLATGDAMRAPRGPQAQGAAEADLAGTQQPTIVYSNSALYPSVEIAGDPPKRDDVSDETDAPPSNWAAAYGFTKSDDPEPPYNGGYTASSVTPWTAGYTTSAAPLPAPASSWPSPYTTSAAASDGKTEPSFSSGTTSIYDSPLVSAKESAPASSVPWGDPLVSTSSP